MSWLHMISDYRAHRELSRADAARERQDWEAAYHGYRRVLGTHPTRTAIVVQMGHAAKELGRLDEAVSLYKRALASDPLNFDTHLQIGHAYKLKGEPAAATDAYLKSFELNPAHGQALRELIAFGWSEADIQHSIPTSPRGHSPEETETFRYPAVSTPPDYRQNNRDVDLLCRLGLLVDGDQHYRLYGKRAGREIVASLASLPAQRVFVLCPSFSKQCGIGEYARYMVQALRSCGYDVTAVRSTRELRELPETMIRDAAVIVNHGPGLFDGYNSRLSEGEPTSSLIANLLGLFQSHNVRSIIYMHSLLDRDNVVMYGRQQLLLDSGIPIVTTIQSAAKYFNITWVEHGVQPMAVEDRAAVSHATGRDTPKIGFFGFFQWGGKDFDALFDAASALRATLVGSVATIDDEQLNRLVGLLKDRGIPCDIGTGWVDDDELILRLSQADYFYLPQNDYDHWNNSGTARFVTNLDRPLILPPHQPFLDMEHVAIFAEDADVPGVMAWLRDPGAYKAAVERVRRYRSETSMNQTSLRVVRDLPKLVTEQAIDRVPSTNSASLVALLMAEAGVYGARLNHFYGGKAVDPSARSRTDRLREMNGMPQVVANATRYPVAEEIALWRRNYDIADFIVGNVQDAVFALFRNVLKREPMFSEYRLLSDTAPIQDGTRKLEVAQSVSWMVDQLGALYARHGSRLRLPEISVGGTLLAPEAVGKLNRSQVENLTVAAVEAFQLAGVSRPAEFGVNPKLDRNIFTILSLPSSVLSKVLRDFFDDVRVSVDFDEVAGIPDRRERFQSLVAALGKAGEQVSDHFICDHPIPNEIDTSRKTYALSDLVIHDGDMFIINLVRSLCKRNPLVVEMFAIGHQLNETGKLATVAWWVQSCCCDAAVIDLQKPDAMAQQLLATDFVQRSRLHQDFRSPVAGGWDLRNRYLEQKRNNSRFWLAMQSKKEGWWRQSGQSIALLSI